MKKTLSLLVIVLCICANISNAQNNIIESKDYSILDSPQYAVYFKDKNNSPYSVSRPLEFLSQRALDRRALRGIAVNETDLPVNPSYVNNVSATGAYVKWTSRWGNFAIVYADNEMLEEIRTLNCVDSIVYIKPSTEKLFPKINHKWDSEKYSSISKNVTNSNDYIYGMAEGQIAQINGIPVHQRGYDGSGMIIAVIDAGFANVDTVSAFDSLRTTNRILLAEDIVEKGGNVYSKNTSAHGTAVLSLMGGFKRGIYVGTAPSASYALIRTEDAETEYLVEEYNWMIGAEIADSIGADIVNSSLGYSTFDDPSMDHQYSQMDGKTAISSIAAIRLTERGVFVVISAGNSYDSNWPWVGTPCDAVEVLTIGAVDLNGNIAYFSSCGPNGAGDPKPNTCACGVNAYVATPIGQFYGGNGTSFSSPITCGMVCCLMGAYPGYSIPQMMSAVQSSADRYPSHDDRYGYGIPDFYQALLTVLHDGISSKKYSGTAYVYPNPADDQITITDNDVIINRIFIYDVTGRMVKDIDVYDYSTTIDIQDINTGMLFMKILSANGNEQTIKLIK